MSYPSATGFTGMFFFFIAFFCAFMYFEVLDDDHVLSKYFKWAGIVSAILVPILVIIAIWWSAVNYEAYWNGS